MASTKRELLVIGAQFSGLFVAREMRKDFNVTVVDAKEFMEFTPGILRAFVKPAHLEALVFLLEPVLTKRLRVRFVLGEVKRLDAEGADVKLLAGGPGGGMQRLAFDYCIICSGCNFGPFHNFGESVWSPTVLEDARLESAWGNLDERYLEGRKQHILREHEEIRALNARQGRVLCNGAGLIGVEWVTELKYFFRDLEITIIDFLPRCLAPLPESCSAYCSKYMQEQGITEHYCVKYSPNNQMFWDQIKMPERADREYTCTGVKACNYFMPAVTLSDKGPGGGRWILINQKLQVVRKPTSSQHLGDVWASGRIFAVGDCNYGCIGAAPNWVMPPVPKVCYPAEEQAYHACKNVRLLDRQLHAADGAPPVGDLKDTWWPWGAGISAVTLGCKDGCLVIGTNDSKGSGMMVSRGRLANFQKRVIERTKMSEMQDRCFGKMIWHFVHRMPVNLWGKGPWLP